MIDLWINPSPKIERSAHCVIRSVHPSSIWKNVCECASGAELAIALPILSNKPPDLPRIQELASKNNIP